MEDPLAQAIECIKGILSTLDPAAQERVLRDIASRHGAVYCQLFEPYQADGKVNLN